jgi:hypothetical protein
MLSRAGNYVPPPPPDHGYERGGTVKWPWFTARRRGHLLQQRVEDIEAELAHIKAFLTSRPTLFTKQAANDLDGLLADVQAKNCERLFPSDELSELCEVAGKRGHVIDATETPLGFIARVVRESRTRAEMEELRAWRRREAKREKKRARQRALQKNRDAQAATKTKPICETEQAL